MSAPKIDEELVVVRQLTSFISMNCLGVSFSLRIERDVVRNQDGRIFLQVIYMAPCSKTGISAEWKGRKWYLSEWMTDDEVVKTAYAAFEAAVRHEIMEGFKINGTPLFNPHASYLALLEASRQEVSRASSDTFATI